MICFYLLVNVFENVIWYSRALVLHFQDAFYYVYILCCVSYEYLLIAVGDFFVFRQFSSNRTPSEKDVVM
jgi:hypothetical protein